MFEENRRSLHRACFYVTLKNNPTYKYLEILDTLIHDRGMCGSYRPWAKSTRMRQYK